MALKIYPSQLKDLFVEIFSLSNSFIHISGSLPFLMEIAGRKYYVYIKNISSAYFKDRPDTTRAQLPAKEDFNEISKSSIPFIFLGYDQINDVVVCWNPKAVKERLNAMNNVSFYSRTYFQEEVMTDEFKSAYLTNGDKLILFKRRNLVDFFLHLDTFFTEDSPNKQEDTLIQDIQESGKLTELTDTIVINKILPALKENRVLEAITICMNHYDGQFNDMKLRDWSQLVRKFHSEQ